VYATIEADNHREAHQIAIAMASVFHPSTVMAVKSSAELMTDDIFPPEWWDEESA
jgi:DNA-binding XRE family transcriptional regulator